ncbi:MAG: arylsulfotransferase family protein [Pseudomonadota bacterium]
MPKSFIVFLISLGFLISLIAGAIGFSIAYTKAPPTAQVTRALQAGRMLLATGVAAPENLLLERRADAPEDPFHMHEEDAPRGWRAFMIYDLERDLYEVDLYDADGTKTWTWPVGDPAIAESGALNSDRIHPHGLIIEPDGSIIINGLAKEKILASYDQCGVPNWTRQEYFHHLMSRADDGTIWNWLGRDAAYGQDEVMVRFDPKTGETLQEIEITGDMLHTRPENLETLGLPSYYQKGEGKPSEKRSTDLFHTNDIEALSAELAPAFPMFEAGDLLMSLRNMQAIVVMDPETYEIKWLRQGPWIHQHDPEFRTDGLISVFNNNFQGRYELRSAVVAVNPATGQVSNLFENPQFYSERMGQQQEVTPTVLHVSVPGEGRAFEVDTTTDRILFEFNNRVLEGHNGHLANSVWLPEDFFDEDPKTYSCSN